MRERDIQQDCNNIIIPSILSKFGALIYAVLDKVSHQRLIHKLKFSILNVLEIKIGRKGKGKGSGFI